MTRRLTMLVIIGLLVFGIAWAQNPLDRLRRNLPNRGDNARESQSPASSEINGVKSILSNLRIRFKSQRWSDENWTREIGDYLTRAEKYMAQIGEKDPTHDTAAYARELQPYKDAYAAKGAALAAKDSYRELAKTKSLMIGKLPFARQRLRFEGKREVESYYRVAEEFDYPKTRAQLAEGVRQHPDLATDFHVKRLLQEFPAEAEAGTEGLLSEANRFLELAYQTQARNRTQAAEYAETSLLLTDLMLLITPSDSRALAVKRDAEAAVNKVGGALAAAVYTSAFHKTNAGKIVFFKAPTAVKQENAAAVTTQFKAGEYIYAIAYLKGSLKDLAQLTSRDYLKSIKFRVFIDGNEHLDYAGFPASVTWEQYADAATSYLKFDIIPDPAVIDYANHFHYDSVIKYARVFGQASPRRHKIELRLELGDNTGASGAFELDSSSGQERLLAIADELHREKISKVVLPKPRMANAALQQSFVTALKANGWKQQILRSVITSSEWTIHRNALGVIQFRSIGAAVAMKEPDGRCRYFELSFKQAYRGGGYGATEQYGVGNNYEMACANVNK